MKTNKFPEIIVHLMMWIILLGFPFFFINTQNSRTIYWRIYISSMLVPLTWMAMFYINYLWLVPKVLFKQKTYRYLATNLLFCIVFAVGLHFLQNTNAASPPFRPKPTASEQREMPPIWIFFSRDLLTLALAAGLGATIRLNNRWKVAEVARQKAEKSKAEAELKNLKNQLNPHFLLNTLNNIYALISFDSNKAQKSVQNLSKMLRYVLYDNQADFVPLIKEAEFIKNYIALMRIRLTKDISVQTNINVSTESTTEIAPLIYISLIENAFKHGVAPSKSCFINISLFEDGTGKIVCEIKNSNYPKSHQDKSGHGIGLEQVHKRLELLYPQKYLWEKGITGEEYRSLLVIDTN